MDPPSCNDSERTVEQLIEDLESLVDGDRAEAILLAKGNRVIEPLARYLLSGAPRSISLPRCRAVRILGELGAYSTLISYLCDSRLPVDSVVLFAEDAVRSEAAQELVHWRTEESVEALLTAAKIRATSGVVSALGEFRRSESVPILFALLEDDLCREAAMEALRQMPETAHDYGILLLRGHTDIPIGTPASLRRLRSTLHLFTGLNLSSADWDDLKSWLRESDPETVITIGSIGLKIGSIAERRAIFEALLRVSRSVNWSQESAIEALLDTDRILAVEVADAFARQHFGNRENPNWLDPSLRILRHTLGDSSGFV